MSAKLLFLAILLFLLLFAYPIAYYISSDNENITIKEKDRITTGSGKGMDSKYLVFTNGEVFENTDSWLFLKFNSSDLQNELEIGKTYFVKVAGWRIPFFSMYRTIISISDDKNKEG